MNEIGRDQDMDLIVEGNHTMEVGRLACGHLLAQSKRPTAILCSNDMTAIGVMRKCYEDGIAIPRDLSVVGFDDIRLAQFMLPPLTTVQMSQAELARLAFKALLTEVERDTPAPNGTEYVLQTDLILRKSTALVPTSTRDLRPLRGEH